MKSITAAVLIGTCGAFLTAHTNCDSFELRLPDKAAVYGLDVAVKSKDGSVRLWRGCAKPGSPCKIPTEALKRAPYNLLEGDPVVLEVSALTAQGWKDGSPAEQLVIPKNCDEVEDDPWTADDEGYDGQGSGGEGESSEWIDLAGRSGVVLQVVCEPDEGRNIVNHQCGGDSELLMGRCEAWQQCQAERLITSCSNLQKMMQIQKILSDSLASMREQLEHRESDKAECQQELGMLRLSNTAYREQLSLQSQTIKVKESEIERLNNALIGAERIDGSRKNLPDFFTQMRVYALGGKESSIGDGSFHLHRPGSYINCKNMGLKYDSTGLQVASIPLSELSFDPATNTLSCSGLAARPNTISRVYRIDFTMEMNADFSEMQVASTWHYTTGQKQTWNPAYTLLR